MKKVALLLLGFFSVFHNHYLSAQCILSATTDTQAEVLQCITNCGCTEVRIPNGVSIEMDGSWNLTTAGNITIRIQGSGSLRFSGPSGPVEQLILTPASKIVIENTSNGQALFANPSGSQVRIIFDNPGATPDVTYQGNQFSTLIQQGGVAGPLPIELSTFSADPLQSTILLTWRTATELNNDYMAVERSHDGIAFDEIGRVAGKGTTLEPQSYTFTDASPVPGLNYYRLRQVDFDGTTTYHQVISVPFRNGASAFALRAFPNPAGAGLQVSWDGPAESPATLRLLDPMGRQLAEYSVPAGTSNFELPLNSLPGGLYVVQVSQGGLTEVLRFRKE